ncbi:MAG: DinB family protein [Candidatus Nanopelagicaceae bacterium]
MTIGLDRLLAHMKWANQLTIEHVQTLPDEALKAYATNPEWFVGEIMHHIVDAADAYVYRITEKRCELPGEGIQELESIADLANLKIQAELVDSALQECSKLDDIQLEFKNYSGNLVKRWRSTILSQAIHHATEHRAQIASALEAKGFKPVDLDELDLWRFEINNG